MASLLFTTSGGFGWFYSSAPISGWLLVLVHTVIYLGARSSVRNSGRFEVFYYTHRLYTVYVLLALLHGDKMWAFLLLPGLLFLLEKLRASRWNRRTEVGQMTVEKAIVWQSGVRLD